ncbi:MAG: hypothetical protein HGA87_02905 [Desulfobulbaceae bacterium]|nr:hypothetical protein [Desulfobulbaceae bacterium]
MLLIDKYPEHSILIKFGDQCIWAWEVFRLAKNYCNNESIIGWCGLDTCLAVILKEYSLLQVAKLHDPESSCGHENHSFQKLTSDYYANKDPLIIDFLKDNKEFIDSSRDARRKSIAHSDLQTIRINATWGAFPDGADDKYFSGLHAAVDYLYRKAGIGLFPEWPTFIDADFEEFLIKIKRSANQGMQADQHHA